ncbi:MAG: DUF5615 family PIN-like protein [Gammaproteobacteria bacterium]
MSFPLPLYHNLRAAGLDVEHIIVLGQRGLPDARIRQRLASERLLFLTQDTEFADTIPGYGHHIPRPPKPTHSVARRDLGESHRRLPYTQAERETFRATR